MPIRELIDAVERGATEALTAALRADPALAAARTHDGDTLLHLACWQKQPAIAALLLTSGAGPNARGCYGRTPLHYAVHEGGPASAAIVRLLLDHGADPTLRDDNGYPAETWARKEMHGPDLADVLRELGSSPLVETPAVSDDFASVLAQVRTIETQNHTHLALTRMLEAFRDEDRADARQAASGLPGADLRCLTDAQHILDAAATTTWAPALRQWLRDEGKPAQIEALLQRYLQTTGR